MAKKQEIEKAGKLNEIIYIETIRPNGSLRIQQDFEFCPSMAEQHTSHLTNVDYLMEKYQPDELALYLATKNQHRQEILGHDFSNEPELQESMNAVYRLKTMYSRLPDEITRTFKNPVEFLKFIDNPANAEKMMKLGLLKPKEISDFTNVATTTTQEATKQSESATKSSSES